MKKLSIVLVTLINLATLSCSVGYASNRAGAITGTLGEGYEYFAQRRNMDNVGVPFLILGYDFTCHWGIEGFLGKFTTKFKPSQHDDRQISGTLFAVDGVFHFTPYKMLEPFVLAGVGITGLNPNSSGANNEGNINAGAGAQFFIYQSVALRAEARDFYSTVGGKNDVLIDAGVTVLLDT